MEAAVTQTEGVKASAKVLIQEFAKYVAANATNPAVLTAFTDRILASDTPLSDAVAANPDPDTTD
jgi:hypothetical protein